MTITSATASTVSSMASACAFLLRLLEFVALVFAALGGASRRANCSGVMSRKWGGRADTAISPTLRW